MQQTQASEKERKTQNIQPKAKYSVDYILIDSDKESGELEISKEFEENTDIQDVIEIFFRTFFKELSKI